MKKYFFLILALPLFLGSCVKDECSFPETSIVASSSEIASIQAYLASISATATQHSSGVFYTINTPGSGNGVGSLCNTIVVTYNAYKFGSGTPFNSYSDPAGIAFVLGTLITGVQKVMPLVKPGGSITMYIPPSLAYGNQPQRDANGAIILPANSYIKFEMSLLGIR